MHVYKNGDRSRLLPSTSSLNPAALKMKIHADLHSHRRVLSFRGSLNLACWVVEGASIDYLFRARVRGASSRQNSCFARQSHLVNDRIRRSRLSGEGVAARRVIHPIDVSTKRRKIETRVFIL